MKATFVALALTCASISFAETKTTLQPGARTLMLAHNAYPDHGKFGDRLDRVITAGTPFAVEEDLAWVDGKSLLIHGGKNLTKDDPTMESYFFPKIKPVIEKALKENKKSTWPVVTLYLDLKNDPIEHLEAVAKMLEPYHDWMTSSVKTADASKPAELNIRPMLVIVEDKVNDIKQEFFYDRVPVGGTIRVFGSLTKVETNPDKKLSKQEAVDAMAALTPEQIFTTPATTYRRWFGGDWSLIEKGGQVKAGEWTKEKETRLRQMVEYGHKKGYLVSFYCLNGYTEAENQGWDKGYNFGSKAAVMPRWKAVMNAKADFLATDQYEDVRKMLH